jgi:hypothetical protein
LELWQEIAGFETYAISNYGRVRNLRRDSILLPSVNRQGIAKVGLFSSEGLTSRSVAALVADAFLERDRPEFDTPIQLDGDRTNCHIENLMWRPRWFAVKYHRQFYVEQFRFFKPNPFFEIETEEVFEDYIKPCTTYGLHYRDVQLSYLNNGRDPVFPTWQRFRILGN